MITRFTERTLAGILATGFVLAATTLGGCARTLGAPRDDLGSTESAAEAMDEEEESEAWESVNE